MKGNSRGRVAGLLRSPWVVMPALLLMWGSFAAGSKRVLQRLDVHQLQFYLYLLAAAAFLPVAAVAARKPGGGGLPKSKWRWARLAVCGVLAYLYYFFYNTALSLLPAVEASLIHYAYPLLIMVFTLVSDRVHPDGNGVLSLVLGTMGMAVVVTGGRFGGIALSDWRGDLCAFAAAVCWALFSVLGRKNTGNMMLNNGIYLGMGALLATLELFLFSKPVLPPPGVWPWLVWLGCFSFALSNCVWFYALTTMDVGLVVSMTYLTPFVALCCIALLLGERVGLAEVAGMGVILLSIFVQRRGPFGTKQSKAQPKA